MPPTAALMRVLVGSHNNLCLITQPEILGLDVSKIPERRGAFSVSWSGRSGAAASVSRQPPVTSLHLRQSIFLRQPAALEEGRRKKKKTSFITADVRARRHGNTAQKFSHCDSIQSSVSGLRCLNLKCCVDARACVCGGARK